MFVIVGVADFFRHVPGLITVTNVFANSFTSQTTAEACGSTAAQLPLEHGCASSHATPARVPSHVQYVTSWTVPVAVDIPWPIALFVVSCVMLLSVQVKVHVSPGERTL